MNSDEFPFVSSLYANLTSYVFSIQTWVWYLCILSFNSYSCILFLATPLTLDVFFLPEFTVLCCLRLRLRDLCQVRAARRRNPVVQHQRESRRGKPLHLHRVHLHDAHRRCYLLVAHLVHRECLSRYMMDKFILFVHYLLLPFLKEDGKMQKLLPYSLKPNHH